MFGEQGGLVGSSERSHQANNPGVPSERAAPDPASARFSEALQSQESEIDKTFADLERVMRELRDAAFIERAALPLPVRTNGQLPTRPDGGRAAADAPAHVDGRIAAPVGAAAPSPAVAEPRNAEVAADPRGPEGDAEPGRHAGPEAAASEPVSTITIEADRDPIPGPAVASGGAAAPSPAVEEPRNAEVAADPRGPEGDAERGLPAGPEAAAKAASEPVSTITIEADRDPIPAREAPGGAAAPPPAAADAKMVELAAEPRGSEGDAEPGRHAGPDTAAKAAKEPVSMVTIEADRGPILAREAPPSGSPSTPSSPKGPSGGSGGGGVFHKRLGPIDFNASLKAGVGAVRRNLRVVMLFTVASNILVLAIPIYLFQISDRILTSRSLDTLVMLTAVIVGAVVLQAMFDAIRRFILMRTAVEFAAQLGAPVLSAAARASLQSNGREYQTLGDLQQVRSFLVSRTLLSFLDAPLAPIFVLAVFLIHIHLGLIVVLTALLLLALTLLNQKSTAAPFGEANTAQIKANLHLESMSRNSQIINALAMIPEAVQIWGRDTADSLRSQVVAQDRNIVFAALSKASRLLTQVAMLGWGAFLSIEGELTGGMVIAASIIAGRALAPIEGAIEGWHQYSQSRSAFGRISSLLKASPLNFERLNLPRPAGRLDVERLLYVPQGTKRVVLNGVSFALAPGDSLGVIGNSGAGKTTLGKMLVNSILPTSGSVRLDLMDLRNWDQRQLGENVGYLPQDVQLFPGTIKANIGRMRDDATDAQIYEAARLADVHEMIANLPHGYETIVAADGAPLSGGQKQRIALARAFFGSPRLVVLDEPNSNLDSAGDAALMRALQHAKEHKITVITITQRPALLNHVDKVLLLVNGTVALFGLRIDVLKALAARGVQLDPGTGSFGHQQIQQGA